MRRCRCTRYIPFICTSNNHSPPYTARDHFGPHSTHYTFITVRWLRLYLQLKLSFSIESRAASYAIIEFSVSPSVCVLMMTRDNDVHQIMKSWCFYPQCTEDLKSSSPCLYFHSCFFSFSVISLDFKASASSRHIAR